MDETGRTNDPAIFAAGDCTRHPSSPLRRSIRLETVHNAIEQARTAARSMLGIDARYNQAPWVWSDQYDVRVQAVGDCAAYDHTVTRGAPDDGRFSILYYAGERFVGLSAVNRPADFGAARRVLDQGAPLPSEQAADPAYDLSLAAPRDPTRWFERSFSRPAGRSHA